MLNLTVLNFTWVELLVLLAAFGFLVVVSVGPRTRAVLLAVGGTLGFFAIVLAVLGAIVAIRDQNGSEVARIEISDGFTSTTIDAIDLPIALEASPRPKSTSDKAKPGAAKPGTSKPGASKAASAKPPSRPTAPTTAAPATAPPIQLDRPIGIDEQTRVEIERQWREDQLHTRLRTTGATSGGVLLLLATLFGYLKVDSLTGARHRRTLQTAAAGVILAGALLAALAAEGRLGF